MASSKSAWITIRPATTAERETWKPDTYCADPRRGYLFDFGSLAVRVCKLLDASPHGAVVFYNYTRPVLMDQQTWITSEGEVAQLYAQHKAKVDELCMYIWDCYEGRKSFKRPMHFFIFATVGMHSFSNISNQSPAFLVADATMRMICHLAPKKNLAVLAREMPHCFFAREREMLALPTRGLFQVTSSYPSAALEAQHVHHVQVMPNPDAMVLVFSPTGVKNLLRQLEGDILSKTSPIHLLNMLMRVLEAWGSYFPFAGVLQITEPLNPHGPPTQWTLALKNPKRHLVLMGPVPNVILL